MSNQVNSKKRNENNSKINSKIKSNKDEKEFSNQHPGSSIQNGEEKEKEGIFSNQLIENSNEDLNNEKDRLELPIRITSNKEVIYALTLNELNQVKEKLATQARKHIMEKNKALKEYLISSQTCINQQHKQILVYRLNMINQLFPFCTEELHQQQYILMKIMHSLEGVIERSKNPKADDKNEDKNLTLDKIDIIVQKLKKNIISQTKSDGYQVTNDTICYDILNKELDRTYDYLMNQWEMLQIQSHSFMLDIKKLLKNNIQPHGNQIISKNQNISNKTQNKI